MKKVWFDEAWDDQLYWQMQDRKTLKRINVLLKDIERGYFDGIGKPEPLKGELSGFWSRRIDDTNRFVYRISSGVLEILSCRGHYEDQRTGKPFSLINAKGFERYGTGMCSRIRTELKICESRFKNLKTMRRGLDFLRKNLAPGAVISFAAGSAISRRG